MASLNLLNRRVRVRREEEEDDELSESSVSGQRSEDSSAQEGESGSEDDESEVDDLSESSEASNPDINTSLSEISFGALAKAQASLGKREHRDRISKPTTALDDIRQRIRAVKEEKDKSAHSEHDKQKPRSFKLDRRSSKHAPTIQSSKYAVTRRRTVVEPTHAAKPRDPRFDVAVLGRTSATGSAAAAANKNYEFLDSYRASELAELRQQLAKAKTTGEKASLKRTITSLTDKERAFEQKKRELEVMTEHRKRERELIRTGKKSQPWFLKKGDVRKEVLVRRYEGMSGKQRQRTLERRRKKVAGKERKEMPWVRRGEGGPTDGPPGRERDVDGRGGMTRKGG